MTENIISFNLDQYLIDMRTSNIYFLHKNNGTLYSPF